MKRILRILPRWNSRRASSTGITMSSGGPVPHGRGHSEKCGPDAVRLVRGNIYLDMKKYNEALTEYAGAEEVYRSSPSSIITGDCAMRERR